MQRGDVVYVVTNGHGAAALAQLPEAQGALVALDPNDGAVAALVGGFDYFDNKFNRVTQARRQPGSGFKPFLYSAALENGFTPATIVMDAPIVYDDSGQEKIWRPENNEKGFDGPMRLREALVHSRNLVTIRVVRQLGIDTAIDYASKVRLQPDDMPKDMTHRARQPAGDAAADGHRLCGVRQRRLPGRLLFIDRIEDASGQVVYQAKPKVVCEQLRSPPLRAAARRARRQPGGWSVPTARRPRPPDAGHAGCAVGTPWPPRRPLIPIMPRRTLAAAADRAASIAPRVISPQNCWIMDDMMADVIKRGTGIRAGMALHRNDISGKTGTTNEAIDTWFNGFNRNIVASVWVGFDQERPLGEGEEGSRTAVPIWINFMREALRGQPDRPRPHAAGSGDRAHLARTGALAGANDADAMYETFMEDHLPPAASDRQRACRHRRRRAERQQR